MDFVLEKLTKQIIQNILLKMIVYVYDSEKQLRMSQEIEGLDQLKSITKVIRIYKFKNFFFKVILQKNMLPSLQGNLRVCVQK